MRLIDADGIVKVAEHAYNEWNLAMAAADTNRKINLVYKREELCQAIKAVADSMPTVDAAPVKHGRWEERDGKTWCTECGCSNKAYKPPYCPHCGAKMDKGNKNE